MQNIGVMEAGMDTSKCKRTAAVIRILAWFLTAAGLIKALFISLDIDESYLVACAYRIVNGDRLFLDMWEPHQLASLIPSVFVKIFLSLTGSTEGIVLALRFIGVFIHLSIGIIFYFFLRKKTHRYFAEFLLLIHINFLPKWVQSLDFELMAYWALLCICMLLLSAGEKEKGSLIKCVAAGVLLTVSMLSYPSYILLYPVFAAGILICSGKRMSKVCGFTAGAFFTGILVIGILLGNFPASDLYKNISGIFLNPSHATKTLSEKLISYAADGIKGLVIWGAITLPGYIISGKILKIKDKKYRLAAASLLAFIALQTAMIAGCVFFNTNQFYLQGRYAALIFSGSVIMISRAGNKMYRKLLWFAVIPGITAVISVMAVTNMNASAAWSKAMPAVYAAIYCLWNEYSAARTEEKDDGKSRVFILSSVSAVFLLAGLFVCRLILIRVTGCLPVTVMAPLGRVDKGPAKGLYIAEDFALTFNSEYDDLAGVYSENEKVLYVGAEMLTYLDHPCIIASPSTEGTTVYDEYFISYFEKFPERKPDIVVYDKNYTIVPEYRRYPSEYVIDEWISENCTEIIKDTPDFVILRCDR